ncbi:HDIG domain-containing protein [Sansalvadorimonas sp. 2012CJ34-2]|uniref:HDIG domain-containing protein n=1 Tax=Parendozoicomonas callyspongiae TaxID=2942213 RepID=A0ABT0PCF7_9GAMM|nr:HDIG domain-containing metalloprotein [Sansalvadorimonas sp. 2012CJ34-2]MCL6269060.1 HDIG domain-containing protein [Sansalvadorimonas sp. 2012CJ34-2]
MPEDNVVKRIIQLYRRFGGENYGEQVTLLDHAFQAADLASTDGCDDEMIAAAFLHDIGHLLEHDGLQPMGHYDARAHDLLGADYLAAAGFSGRIVKLVASHVQAKRYLCTVENDYYETLSETSKESLEFQGGIMSADETSDFSIRPDLEDVLALRRYDDEAKVVGRGFGDLNAIETLLEKRLEQRAAVA